MPPGDVLMLFSLGVTIMDILRNEYIRGTVQLGRFVEKTREARLVWCGYVSIGTRMLRM